MGKFFSERGADYGPTGWITETGEFIECSSFEHDQVAEEKTGECISEIEKKWIRISLLFGKNLIQFAGDNINNKQIIALDEWGIDSWVKKKRCSLSENFIEVYFK